MLNNDFDNLEEDWENIEIPDLIINFQETVKNKEREKRLLEERKMMEEADLALTNELFDEIKEQINDNQTKDRLNLDRLNLDKIKIVKLTKEKPEELKMLKIKKEMNY